MPVATAQEDAQEKCKDCNGKGRYVVKETYQDGDECLVAYDCNTCGGTGKKPSADGSEDFSIDGGGEDDDD